MIRAAVAAGHPATAEAGAENLADGGTAADAAVAASLASCVAETVMTGFLGGAHAIHFDAASGRVVNLDAFVAVPSGTGAPMAALEVPFGEQLVSYAIGASSCGVPGLPAGLDALWRTTADCRGRGSSSPPSGLPATVCRCRRHTSPAWRCSSR